MLENYNSTYNGCGNFKNVNHTFHREWWEYKSTDLPSGWDGYYTSDVDDIPIQFPNFEGAVHYDLSGNIMLVERKCYMGEPSQCQKRMMQIIDYALRFTYDKAEQFAPVIFASGKSASIPITYHGYHLLQFKTTLVVDDEIFWDGQPISRDQLTGLLTFNRLL